MKLRLGLYEGKIHESVKYDHYDFELVESQQWTKHC